MQSVLLIITKPKLVLCFTCLILKKSPSGELTHGIFVLPASIKYSGRKKTEKLKLMNYLHSHPIPVWPVPLTSIT